MSPRRVLQVTFWLAVVLQTIGSVDLPGVPSKSSPLGGAGTRKMPAPRAYVAIVVLWSILGLVAELGSSTGKLAARLSLVTLLVGAVVGPFGSKAIGLLETVSSRFAIAPPAPGSTSSPAAPSTSGGFA